MLSKCTHLGECKVNEETSLYEHSNKSIEVNAYLILNYEMRNHLMRYDVVMVEASFHDV